MGLFGVDYSLGKPDLSCAKQKGVEFVCRYLSTPGNPKNLTISETVACKALGIDIVLVFETDANRATAGWNAGVVDAHAAASQAGLLGLEGAPIYFAVDFDVPDYARDLAEGPLFAKKKLGPVGLYLGGVASVLGKGRTGVYGGYYVVRRAFDAGLVKYGWQTYAWSGTPTMWDVRAQIQQYKNGQAFCGGEVDFNRALAGDFGQATKPSPVPAPPPAPVPQPAPYPTTVLRNQLRGLILNWKARGKSWGQIAGTHAWKLYRNLGGK